MTDPDELADLVRGRIEGGREGHGAQWHEAIKLLQDLDPPTLGVVLGRLRRFDDPKGYYRALIVKFRTAAAGMSED